MVKIKKVKIHFLVNSQKTKHNAKLNNTNKIGIALLLKQ